MSTNLQPARNNNRIIAIDALRGFALFGILLVNAAFFALPSNDVLSGSAGMDTAADEWTALLISILAESKFIAIFSLLFGAGLAIQHERAMARGKPFLPFAYRRLLVLAGFGLIHALCIWYGDILFIYACYGAVLVLLMRFSAFTLVMIGVWASVIGAIFGTGVFALMTMFDPGIDLTTNDADTTLRGFEAIGAAQLNPEHPTWRSAEIAAYAEGPFLDAFAFRATNWIFAFVFQIFLFGGHITSMFCLGAALWKSGFFRGEGPGVRWRKPLFLAGLLVGLPLAIVGGLVSGDDANPILALIFFPLQLFGSELIALGIAALFMMLGEHGRLPLARGLAAIGRMSLTAYLLESLAFTFITNWWGLGMFNAFGRFELFLISLGIYVSILILCVIWLRFASIGPAEWLWRTLAYMKPPGWKTRPIQG